MFATGDRAVGRRFPTAVCRNSWHRATASVDGIQHEPVHRLARDRDRHRRVAREGAERDVGGQANGCLLTDRQTNIWAVWSGVSQCALTPNGYDTGRAATRLRVELCSPKARIDAREGIAAPIQRNVEGHG